MANVRADGKPEVVVLIREWRAGRMWYGELDASRRSYAYVLPGPRGRSRAGTISLTFARPHTRREHIVLGVLQLRVCSESPFASLSPRARNGILAALGSLNARLSLSSGPARLPRSVDPL